MTEHELVVVARALVLPPGINLVLALLGILVLGRYRKLAMSLLLGSSILLYGLSMPVVGTALMSTLQDYPPLDLSRARQGNAGAVVVLGCGRYPQAPEYGDDTVSECELVRLRYAARLYRATSLPILLSGGGRGGSELSEAFLMKEALVDDFRVPVVWTEEQSRNTWENAGFSQSILAREGIGDVYLVTDAWSMPRAMEAFRQVGLRPEAAPTGFVTLGSNRLSHWLPNAKALMRSSLAVYEHLGRIWYRWRYY